MCELARHGMAGVRRGMCELAFKVFFGVVLSFKALWNASTWFRDWNEESTFKGRVVSWAERVAYEWDISLFAFLQFHCQSRKSVCVIIVVIILQLPFHVLANECGCWTWSFTLGKNTPLEVFGVRLLRREFGPNRRKQLEAGKNP